MIILPTTHDFCQTTGYIIFFIKNKEEADPNSHVRGSR
jgi:hypothetical protein